MNTPITMLAAVVPSSTTTKDKHGKRRSVDLQLLTTTTTTGDNYFDLLPDDLVHQILNRILDAKSLCQCLILSKRFATLVPEVNSLSILATQPNLSTFYSTTKKPPTSKWTKNFLKKLVHNLIIKPLEFFQPISLELTKPTENNKIGPAEITQWISNSLKNFTTVQSLRLELPPGGGVVGFPEDVPLLRWSAQFGKQLETCAIIAATSFEDESQDNKPQTTQTEIEDKQQSENKDDDNDDNNNNMEIETSTRVENNSTNQNQPPLLSDADLKTRVVWILSCLIAAGARHGLARQMVLDCPNLRIAEMIDSGKQGKLSMNEKQINTLRESIATENSTTTTSANTDPIWKRSAIPNLIMKLWYVPELKLKGSGKVMKGATVVIVKPDGEGAEKDDDYEDDDVKAAAANGFCEDKDEGIAEAAKEIMKSKWRLMYKMQMNSF